MKTIILEEKESKASRILLAATRLKLADFVKFQGRECEGLEPINEIHVMRQVGKHLGIEMQRIQFSKYNLLLQRVWITARACKVVVLDINQTIEVEDLRKIDTAPLIKEDVFRKHSGPIGPEEAN